MDITFIVAIGIFLIFVSLILVTSINYFTRSSQSQTILETRDKVKNLFDILFGSGGIVTNERLTTNLYRIPVLLQEQNGTARTNEVVAITANFDNDCTQLVSYNNSVRVYDQQFVQLPSKISYQQFCNNQLLNNSLVTFVVNMSANESKRVYVYSINNTNTTAPNWNLTLQGYWKFDDAGGTTATDSSGLQNNGTLNNFEFNSASGWYNGTSCEFGSCLKFDGTDDYVNVTNLLGSGFSNYTVTAWVNTSRLGTEQHIAEFGTVQFYKATDDNIKVTVNGQTVTGPSALTANKWYHVAMVYNSSTSPTNVTVYVNGVAGTSGTVSGSPTSTFHIGRLVTNSNSNWNGTLDDVRIYNETLTPSQISSLALAVNQPLSVTTFSPENITAVSATKVQQLTGRNYQDVKTVLGGDYDFRVEIK